MDYERSSKADKYHQKKINKQKHDKAVRVGLNEQEVNLLDHIAQMDPYELSKFMDNKFEKIISTNEKLLPKIYTAVSKRMKKYLEEYEKEEREKFSKFVFKHTGYKVTPEDIKEVFEMAKGHHYKPNQMTNNEQIFFSYVKDKQSNKIVLARVMRKEPKQQFSNVVEKYYVQGINEAIFHDLDIKRFKKDCSGILQQYTIELEKVKKALKEE